MEGIRETVIEKLRTKYRKLTEQEMNYLNRDQWIYDIGFRLKGISLLQD